MKEKVTRRKLKVKNLVIITLILIILVAIWLVFIFFISKPSTYRVKFNTAGASKIRSVEVTKNTTIKSPHQPVKEGYNFLGWYYEDQLFDFKTKINENMTLIAKWEQIGENNPEEIIAVESVSLNQASLTMSLYGSQELKLTITPDNATNKNVTWSSSDESVAIVDEKGKIKALKVGETVITVTTEDGAFTASCTVKVINSTIKVTGVQITGEQTIKVGQSLKYTAIINPNNATNKNVSWSVSDNTIATIDGDGNLTALKEGTITLAVTTKDGGFKSSLEVKVIKEETSPEEENPPVEPDPDETEPEETNPDIDDKEKPEKPDIPITLTITGPNTVNVDEEITLSYTLEPKDITIKEVKWESSDSGKATVTNGTVKGVSAGSVTITVIIKTENNETEEKKATYTITITEKAVEPSGPNPEESEDSTDS